MVLASNGGASNSPDPFLGNASVDTVFMTPTGNQDNTYVMSDTGGSFTGDLANRWDIKLSELNAYLGGSDLVFLFDNNQSSNGVNQYINLWGQARIVDINGNTVNNMCFELSTGGGCDLAVNPMPAADKFVPVISDFCVDRLSGASYNIGTAQNAGSCPVNAQHPQGGYQVNNNVSTASAEFAAFNQSLNDFVKNAANGQYYLSLNVKYSGNDAGAEQLWICSDCSVGATNVPEPGSLALLGLGLLGAGVARRKKAA